MQKAIRRGDLSIARRAGHQLYALDRARLWRRLMVASLEDIGIADLDVVAELVAISMSSAARRLLGGDIRALDIALVRACAATKDRSGDHLASIVGREPMTDADRTALRSASPNALLAMIATSDLPWIRRLRTAVIVAGRSDHPVRSVATNIGRCSTCCMSWAHRPCSLSPATPTPPVSVMRYRYSYRSLGYCVQPVAPARSSRTIFRQAR